MSHATKKDPWGTRMNLGSSINSANDDMDPSLSTDSRELYVSSNRPGGSGNYHIWITTPQNIRTNARGLLG